MFFWIKRFSPLIWIAFLSISAHSQGFDWVKIQGGNGNEISWATTIDNDGNHIVSRGSYLSKYTPDGTEIWNLPVEFIEPGKGSPSILVFDIKADSSLNFYLTGCFIGEVDFDFKSGLSKINAGESGDGFLAKYDPHGSLIWVKSFTSTAKNIYSGVLCRKISLMENQDLIVAGDFYDTANFNSGNSNFSLAAPFDLGNSDIFFMKISKNGLIDFVNQIGNSSDEEGFPNVSMGIDGNENIYISSIATSNTDLDPGQGIFYYPGNWGGFISKYDKFGSLDWVKELEGNIYPEDILVTKKGHLYLTGWFKGPAQFEKNNSKSHLNAAPTWDNHSFLVKYDQLGNFAWARGFSGLNFSYAISSTIDERIFIAGNVKDSLEIMTANGKISHISKGQQNLSNDSYLAGFDKNGLFESLNVIEAESSIIRDLTTNGNFTISGVGEIAGTVTKIVINGDTTQAILNGGLNSFIFSKDFFSPSSNSSQLLKVYPNPSNNKVFIANHDITDIKVYSGRGKHVNTYDGFEKNKIIELDLARGVYFISVHTVKQERKIFRVVIN